MNTLLQNIKTLPRILFVLLLAFVFLAPAMNAQSLVGWWKMDEGSGTTLVDASGNGFNGTIVNSPTWITGVIDSALNLNFAVTNQRATVPDTPSLDLTTGMTLAAWIRPNITTTQSILRKSTQTAVDGYEIALSGGGNIFIRLNQFTHMDNYRLNSTTLYPTNTWTHVAGTFDGDTMRIYINGVLEDSLAAPITIATNTLNLGIGAQPDGGSPFRGAIDDARIYNYALTTSEIQTLASAIPPPVLNTPANNSPGQPIPITLNWYASFGATSYTVQVSTVSDFSSFAYNTSGMLTTSTSVSSLSMNTLYYWRVNAATGSGDSPWSTVWNFTTMNVPTIINNGAGYCLNFDGSTNRVTVPDNNILDLTTTATIEAWFKPASTGTPQRIVCKGNSSGYELFISSGGNISFRINFNDTYRVTSSTTVTTGSWIYAAGTYDGTTMKLFVNGVQEGGNVSGTTITQNTAVLSIGSQSNGIDAFFNGAIDEVRIWNIARDSIAIRNDMCKKLTGSESGLVGYWRFNEDSGIDMSDETSNGFDGTLNGTISGTTHDWSGAALGDASAYDYTGDPGTPGDFTENVVIGGETFTVTGDGGTDFKGIQIYRVDDISMRTGSSDDSSWTTDPLRYWGAKVFGTGSPTYQLVYNYTAHPGFVIEKNLRLVSRDNISDATWSKVTTATLDSTNNTLTATGQTGTEYALASTSDPLPVELSAFSAKISRNNVLLKWRTETEVSNYGFEVQRSSQKDKWDVLGFVPGNGNSNSPKDYSFTDDKVTPGKYSYRLKQIDTDGQFSYSKTIQVNFGSAVKFELSQNYPNPFNPVTTIQFSIPQSGNVKLTVFNILGEQVAVLVNEFKDSGVHTINFDAGQFNSGLYVYKLESSGFVQTRKMLLVK